MASLEINFDDLVTQLKQELPDIILAKMEGRHAQRAAEYVTWRVQKLCDDAGYKGYLHWTVSDTEDFFINGCSVHFTYELPQDRQVEYRVVFDDTDPITHTPWLDAQAADAFTRIATVADAEKRR